MGFLLELLVEAVKEKVSDIKDDYNDSYNRNSERYSYMSDEQLKREIEHIKNMGGYDARKMGKIAAMKAELDSRH